jgi:creatinine amidohydrolase/Fe(II)-dependent formamide hydrolase-like protein
MEWGREIVAFRAQHTAKAIRNYIAIGGSVPPPPPPEGQAVAGAGRAGGAGGGGGGAGRAGGAGPAAPPAPAEVSMGGGNCSASKYNCALAPNPLPAPNTVWLEEMTWMDVRDALNAGKTTIIISTGGMEPNGPWLVTGKHNYVLKANCEAIARRLGNALCAPIIPFVPEGNLNPPSGHMTSPGTISLRQPTFEALLTDVGSSLKMHGFKNVIYIGDSGGNQTGMGNVATQLSTAWGNSASAIHIPEYYDYGAVSRHMAEQGYRGTSSDGLHDDPVITLNMFMADPSSVRWAERVKLGLATINGVSIADMPTAVARGQQIVDFRARWTADAILAAINERNR